SHPAKSAKKTISLAGRVGLDGKTVVSDRDSRIWKVVNAEMLLGSEGRQVTIKAYTEANASEIRVMVVRLREERTTAKIDDAAFRGKREGYRQSFAYYKNWECFLYSSRMC